MTSTAVQTITINIPTSQPLGPGSSASSDGSSTSTNLHSYPITPTGSDAPPPSAAPAEASSTMKRGSSRPKMPRMGSMASIVGALSRRSSKANLQQYAPLAPGAPGEITEGIAPLRKTLIRRGTSNASRAGAVPREGVPSGPESMAGSVRARGKEGGSSWRGGITRTMKRMSIVRWNRSISVDQGGIHGAPVSTSSWRANATEIQGEAGDAFPSRIRASLDGGQPPRKPAGSGSGGSSLHVNYPSSAQRSTFARPQSHSRPLSTDSTHSSATVDSTTVIIADPASLPSSGALTDEGIAQPLLPVSGSDGSVQSGSSTYYDAPSDLSPDLSFDVFSPRVPHAPVLHGIQGNFSPISDLELPNGPEPIASRGYPTPVVPRTGRNSPAILPSSRLPSHIAIPALCQVVPLAVDEMSVDPPTVGGDNRKSEEMITPVNNKAGDVPPTATPAPTDEVAENGQQPQAAAATDADVEMADPPPEAPVPYIDPEAVSPKSKSRAVILDSPIAASPDIGPTPIEAPTPIRAYASPRASSLSTRIPGLPSPRRTSTAATSSTSTTVRAGPGSVSGVSGIPRPGSGGGQSIGRSGSVNSFTSSMIRSPLTGLPSPAPTPAPGGSVGFQWSQGTILPYIPGLTPASIAARPAIYPSPTPPSLITSPKSLVAPIREPAALPKPPGWEQSAFERARSRRGSAVLSRLTSPRGSYADLAALGIRATAEPAPVAPMSPAQRSAIGGRD